MALFKLIIVIITVLCADIEFIRAAYCLIVGYRNEHGNLIGRGWPILINVIVLMAVAGLELIFFF